MGGRAGRTVRGDPVDGGCRSPIAATTPEDTLGPVFDLPDPERSDLLTTLDVLLANHSFDV